MCVYKVTFTNGNSANILAKNKEDIDTIITRVLCGNNIGRVFAEIASYQRVYKNGKMGREYRFSSNAKILFAD